MPTIDNQLEAYRLALAEAQEKGDLAIARKIDQQIKGLEEFQLRHPEESNAPSPFEVFCDLNPSDINCRVYDDWSKDDEVIVEMVLARLCQPD